MQYPSEYVTALLTVSATFMAIAGIFIGYILTKEETLKSWHEFLMILSIVSIVFGFFAMVSALSWLGSPNDSLLNRARYSLLFQFATIYGPLVGLVLRFGFRRLKQRQTQPKRG